MPEPPEPHDPRLCSLPHCPIPANGHDWLLGWNRRGRDPLRMGFCSQAHLAIARDWLGSLPLDEIGWIVESNPEDNAEGYGAVRRLLIGLDLLPALPATW